MAFVLDKKDKKFVSFNLIVSFVSMLLSVVPSIVIWVIFEFSKSPTYSSQPAYYLFAFPVILYSMCFATVASGCKAIQKKHIGQKTSILLSANLIISVPLLLGYVWIILMIMSAH